MDATEKTRISDADVARISAFVKATADRLEDLIEMLHRRGLINRDDLPAEALAKLARRAELRRRLRSTPQCDTAGPVPR
jgi:hypothetical protein